MTKPVFLPANFFWHKFFGCPLNRPLCDELHFHKITRLEMSRYSFSGWESAGQPFSLLEIDDIPGIERLVNVKDLTITLDPPSMPHYPKRTRIARLLSKLPHVESLTIHCILTREVPPSMRQTWELYRPMLRQLKRLSLCLECPEGGDPKEFLSCLLPHSMPCLETLHVNGRVEWSTLSGICLPSLKELYCGQIHGLPSLQALLQHLPRLESLELDRLSSFAAVPEPGPALSSSPLRKLTLRDGVLEHTEELAFLELDALTLSNVELDPTVLARLATLRELELTGCFLYEPLPSLTALRRLERLSLSECELPDLELVSGLEQLKILRLDAASLPVHESDEDRYPVEVSALETLPALLSLTIDPPVYRALSQCKPFAERFEKEGYDLHSASPEFSVVVRRR